MLSLYDSSVKVCRHQFWKNISIPRKMQLLSHFLRKAISFIACCWKNSLDMLFLLSEDILIIYLHFLLVGTWAWIYRVILSNSSQYRSLIRCCILYRAGTCTERPQPVQSTISKHSTPMWTSSANHKIQIFPLKLGVFLVFII